MQHYSKIAAMISHIKSTYMLDLSIKDYYGFVPLDADLDNVLRPYLAHTNPYCLFVKETPEGYRRCLSQKPPLYKKCLGGKSFVGYCHAGVCEIVVPIMKNDMAIGSINLSNFAHDTKFTERLIDLTFQNRSIKEQQKAHKLYSDFMKTSSVDISSLVFSLELLAEYLGEVATLKDEKSNMGINEKQQNENAVLMKEIRKYIYQHYMNKMTVSELANHFNISAKKLASVIKLGRGKTFNEYLNHVRIQSSKKLLHDETNSIDTIAKMVGYSETRYYKKVFHSIIGISPEEYIRYYQNEKFQAD